jgi:hypothetical protein
MTTKEINMKKSVLEIRKVRRQKEMQESRNGALAEYEKKQREIEKLLRQIQVGLGKHDLMASGQGGHHWGHVGDLNRIEKELMDIRDRLTGSGEYGNQPTKHIAYNRSGQAVKVVVP